MQLVITLFFILFIFFYFCTSSDANKLQWLWNVFKYLVAFNLISPPFSWKCWPASFQSSLSEMRQLVLPPTQPEGACHLCLSPCVTFSARPEHARVCMLVCALHFLLSRCHWGSCALPVVISAE